MASVADELRAETVRRVLAMTPSERVALALDLGDEDLEIYCKANGLDAAAALRELRGRRQDGRVPSQAAEPAP